jgi:hypothetical protein
VKRREKAIDSARRDARNELRKTATSERPQDRKATSTLSSILSRAKILCFLTRTLRFWPPKILFHANNRSDLLIRLQGIVYVWKIQSTRRAAVSLAMGVFMDFQWTRNSHWKSSVLSIPQKVEAIKSRRHGRSRNGGLKNLAYFRSRALWIAQFPDSNTFEQMVLAKL